MKTIIELTIGAFIFSIPIVAFVVYFRTLNNKAKRVIGSYKNNQSTELTNLNVWVKNFDIFNKTKKFDLDVHATTYDFNFCDITINPDSILVTGRSRILGSTKLLNPTIFSRTGDQSHFSAITDRVVETTGIRTNNSSVELDFIDPNYTNEMTLVIKNISTETIEQIKRATTSAKSADVC